MLKTSVDIEGLGDVFSNLDGAVSISHHHSILVNDSISGINDFDETCLEVD